MATHSSTLALKIPWMEEPGRSLAQATIHGVAKSQARLSDFTSLIHLLGIPGGSDSKASAYNAGDLDSVPGLGRSPGEEHGNPLQYSYLENPMDRGPWWATVHGVAKSWTATEHILLFVGVLRVVSNCDPVDCSPPGSSIHGILQARILEWVAMPSSRGSS